MKFIESKNNIDTMNIIADNIPIGLWRTDSLGNLVYANEAMKELFGKDIHQLQGKKFYRYIHPDDRRKCKEYICSTINHDFPGIEIRVQYKNQTKFVLIQSAELSDGGYVGTLIDITKDKELVPELKKLKDEILQIR